jgi:cell division protein FtsW
MNYRNHIDIVLLIAVLTLMLLSLGIVYSASAAYAFAKYGESEKMLTSHALKVLLGIAALFVGMRIDYRKLQRWTKIALIAAVILLIFTLVAGGEKKGAIRFLSIAGISFQPSEFAKYALLFHLCTLITIKGDLLRANKKSFILMMIWIGLVSSLVMIQPNFSMGAMIFMLSLIVLFSGGAKISHLAITLGVLAPVIVYYMLSADYRIARVDSFFNGITSLFSGSDALEKFAYQVQQSILGFGSGGIFGVGPGESKQRDFFLPESYGDFVFSIVGEEYGFIGTMFFLLLFAVIMLRGFKIAKYAEDLFGRNLAIAITCAITLYALINTGVAIGILPPTGLPMPFVSYGGSSMLFAAFAVGILLNISSQTDLHPRARGIVVSNTPDPVDANVGKVY